MKGVGFQGPSPPVRAVTVGEGSKATAAPLGEKADRRNWVQRFAPVVLELRNRFGENNHAAAAAAAKLGSASPVTQGLVAWMLDDFDGMVDGGGGGSAAQDAQQSSPASGVRLGVPRRRGIADNLVRKLEAIATAVRTDTLSHRWADIDQQERNFLAFIETYREHPIFADLKVQEAYRKTGTALAKNGQPTALEREAFHAEMNTALLDPALTTADRVLDTAEAAVKALVGNLEEAAAESFAAAIAAVKAENKANQAAITERLTYREAIAAAAVVLADLQQRTATGNALKTAIVAIGEAPGVVDPGEETTTFAAADAAMAAKKAAIEAAFAEHTALVDRFTTAIGEATAQLPAIDAGTTAPEKWAALEAADKAYRAAKSVAKPLFVAGSKQGHPDIEGVRQKFIAARRDMVADVTPEAAAIHEAAAAGRIAYGRGIAPAPTFTAIQTVVLDGLRISGQARVLVEKCLDTMRVAHALQIENYAADAETAANAILAKEILDAIEVRRIGTTSNLIRIGALWRALEAKIQDPANGTSWKYTVSLDEAFAGILDDNTLPKNTDDYVQCLRVAMRRLSLQAAPEGLPAKSKTLAENALASLENRNNAVPKLCGAVLAAKIRIVLSVLETFGDTRMSTVAHTTGDNEIALHEGLTLKSADPASATGYSRARGNLWNVLQQKALEYWPVATIDSQNIPDSMLSEDKVAAVINAMGTPKTGMASMDGYTPADEENAATLTQAGWASFCTVFARDARIVAFLEAKWPVSEDPIPVSDVYHRLASLLKAEEDYKHLRYLLARRLERVYQELVLEKVRD